MGPGDSARPITESNSIDLPQPDSFTMPSVLESDREIDCGDGALIGLKNGPQALDGQKWVTEEPASGEA